ncbi:hypothetical protein [Mycolicibacterium austroafricanum]|uniref:Flagellar protein FliT n=1 Tax=Mycolicibacterium austroafricanum TaxID=39687 RepID=A0ABT8HHW1_MYCAO|nr:hypothetical protein [Mycolicibacterium austroafricanum]MDN4520323.1 hypothetical protein [Mycolicibacterium austroafricanum]
MTAGARLRLEMDAALQRASEALGQSADQPLEWTEQERVALDAACAAADRAEVLEAAFEAEIGAEGRPSVLVKLSAEVRALDRQAVDLLGKVNPGLGPGISERHQKASRARWGAKR